MDGEDVAARAWRRVARNDRLAGVVFGRVRDVVQLTLPWRCRCGWGPARSAGLAGLPADSRDMAHLAAVVALRLLVRTLVA